MSARLRRGERCARRRHLQPRDLALLCELARMRVATPAQLARLFFGTLSACHRRLRALASLGLVKIFVVAMHEPNLATLTAVGEAVVVDAGVPPDEVHRARHVYFRDRHAELIVDLRVGFQRWKSRVTPDAHLEAFLSDWDLRRAVGRAAKHAHIPDALVSVRVEEQVTLAFEIDRGGEPLGEIRKKALATRVLFEAGERLFGFANWRPVLLAPSVPRLVTCARVIAAAGVGELWAVGLINPCVSDPAGVSFGLVGDLAVAGDVSVLVRAVLPQPGHPRASF